MEPNYRKSKSNTGKTNRIWGMTPLQIIILSVLACFALTSIGLLAGMILFDTSPNSVATNSPIISSTPIPNNQVNECDSVVVNTWLDQSLPRLNAIDSDLDYLNASSQVSMDDLVLYAENAKQRYYAQLSQSTPLCLETLQEIALEELRLYWRGMESLVNGDPDSASNYFSQLVDLSYQVDQALQEINRNP